MASRCRCIRRGGFGGALDERKPADLALKFASAALWAGGGVAGPNPLAQEAEDATATGTCELVDRHAPILRACPPGSRGVHPGRNDRAHPRREATEARRPRRAGACRGALSALSDRRRFRDPPRPRDALRCGRDPNLPFQRGRRPRNNGCAVRGNGAPPRSCSPTRSSSWPLITPLLQRLNFLHWSRSCRAYAWPGRPRVRPRTPPGCATPPVATWSWVARGLHEPWWR